MSETPDVAPAEMPVPRSMSSLEPTGIANKPVLGAPGGMAGGKSSVPRSYGESGDDYPQVVAVLDNDRRVIECADGIQWIIQKRVSGSRPWRPVYYCRTKAGLLLYARPITPELLALPDYFPEWCDWRAPS